MQQSKGRSIDERTLNFYLSQGFPRQQIMDTFKNSRDDQHFHELLKQPQQSSIIINQVNIQQASQSVVNTDDDIQKAIQLSLALHKQNSVFGKLRKDGVPCGLANVGNTCYFNSLLQGYFFIFDFVETVLKCKFDPQLLQNINDRRLLNSIELVKNLQLLFVKLIASDRQFIDPSDVLKSICDDFGNALPIGDQKDVGEFNYYFLSRVNEGLTYLNTNPQKQQAMSQSVIVSKINENPREQAIQQSEIQQTHSRFLRQSSVVKENTSIFEIFFGKYITQYITQGNIVRQTNPEIFNFIQIDVNSKNLFDGFESYMNQTQEELSYQTGQYIQTVRQLWIIQAPQILNFQIQRVYYNKDYQSMLKENSPFNFTQEIFIDRYLESNQKTSKDIQKQNAQFRDRLKKIQEELQSLVQFDGNIDLINHLELTLKFLKTQNPAEKENPYYIDCNDNKAAIQQISSYHKELIKKRDCLLKEQKDLERRISESYNQMKKHKYVLQSILIHEGSPDAGHYFAYIYNFEQEKWHCFNDANVSEETSEKVIAQSVGDKSNSRSAYLLSYVREDIAKKGINGMIKRRTFSISTNKIYLKDLYGQLITQQQREFILQENQRLYQEVQQNKMQEAVEQILKEYCVYFENLNEKYRNYLQQAFQLPFRPYPTQHLAIYVRSRNEGMYKQIVLDLAMRKISGENYIINPQKNYSLQNLLFEQIKKLNEQKYPVPLEPNITEYNQYNEEFKTILRNSQFAFYVTDQYFNLQFKKAIQGLHQYIKKAKMTHQQSFFFQVAEFLKHQITLGILIQIIQKQNLNETDFQVLKLLVAFQMQEHLQYLEPKFWKEQFSSLIKIAQKDQSNLEIIKPLVQNQKNQEITQMLDQPLQEQIDSAEVLVQYYKDAELNIGSENLASDNLMRNLITLLHNIGVQRLYQEIKSSSTILDQRNIDKILNQQSGFIK